MAQFCLCSQIVYDLRKWLQAEINTQNTLKNRCAVVGLLQLKRSHCSAERLRNSDGEN